MSESNGRPDVWKIVHRSEELFPGAPDRLEWFEVHHSDKCGRGIISPFDVLEDAERYARMMRTEWERDLAVELLRACLISGDSFWADRADNFLAEIEGKTKEAEA